MCGPFPILSRYTYAAFDSNYPMPSSLPVSHPLALPTDPTLCFPVTEFDLSKCVHASRQF